MQETEWNRKIKKRKKSMVKMHITWDVAIADELNNIYLVHNHPERSIQAFPRCVRDI